MYAHLVFLIAHTPERIEHGRIGNGPCFCADRREEVFPFPGAFLKFPKNGHRLPGQGHKMLTAHFHAFRRDAPFPGLKVEFFPLSGPQFRGTGEDQRSQLQGTDQREIAFIGVDIPQKLTDFLRFQHCRPVNSFSRSQGSPEVGRDIVFRPARDDRIAEHLTDDLQHSPGSLVVSPLFQRLDYLHNVPCLQFDDMRLADGRKDIGLQPVHDGSLMLFGKLRHTGFMPFSGDILEAVAFRDGSGLP